MKYCHYIILSIIVISIIALLKIENKIFFDGTLVKVVNTDAEVFVNGRRKAGSIDEFIVSSEIFPVLDLPSTENITIREITAYNVGDSYQCDDTPCISASGDNICKLLANNINVCAANWIPFGTKLEIEGLGKCIVLDRMNKRNANKIDWAMKANEKQKAIQFGRQRRVVRIIK